MLIERANVDDAPAAARLAAAKRIEYERYSPVFWRVAADAFEGHEPFLRFCLRDEGFTSLAAREAGSLCGILIAHHRVGPPPLDADPGTAWLVDDFFVAGDRWEEVGGPLLARLEATSDADRLVVLAARLDEQKSGFLARRGYARAASWWVLPLAIDPELCVDSTQAAGFSARVGPAPPVYDPGGPTALAVQIEPNAVASFAAWAGGQGAVLAIVPARAEERELEAALVTAGYRAASDWWVRAR